MSEPKVPMNAISQVVETLLRADAWRATKYISDKLIVRATRKLYGRKINKNGKVKILLTIGRPAYREREFIKSCKKAGESFPVQKIQIQAIPKKKK
jgi:hypothetical protein